MRIHHLFIAAVTLAVAATTAEAKPHNVVVLDFDGGRQLADSGRDVVLNVLGEDYTIVPTKKWQSAMMASIGRGPQQWAAASKATGVDAVIEGWVNPDGLRMHTMTVAVREAATGRQIDQATARISDRGAVSDSGMRKLFDDLDGILKYIDYDPTASQTKGPYIDYRQLKGSVVPKPEAPADEGDDDDDDDDSGCSDHSRRHHHGRRHKHCSSGHRHPRGDDDDDDDDDDARHGHGGRETERDHGGDVATADKASDAASDKGSDAGSSDASGSDAKAAPKQVAAGTPPITDDERYLTTLFGPDTTERDVVTARKDPVVVHPSPHFEIAAGGFIADRGMSFTQDPPDYPANPPSYPASGLYGLAFTASYYPRPVSKYGSDLTGLGFSFQLQKSVGAQLSAEDSVADTFGSYTLDYTAYEGAIHYRYPLGIVLLDGQVDYGQASWTLGDDFPVNVQIPDTDYEYLGAGGSIDLAVTDRTRVGFGARYMYILSAGGVSDETWYGSGTAAGLDLNAHFRIPLGDMLYIQGTIDYQRVSMDFDGDGNLSTSENDSSLAVSNIVDSTISGSAMIGVSF